MRSFARAAALAEELAAGVRPPPRGAHRVRRLLVCSTVLLATWTAAQPPARGAGGWAPTHMALVWAGANIGPLALGAVGFQAARDTAPRGRGRSPARRALATLVVGLLFGGSLGFYAALYPFCVFGFACV